MNRKVLGFGVVAALVMLAGVMFRRSSSDPAQAARPALAAKSSPTSPAAVPQPKDTPKLDAKAEKAMAHSRVFVNPSTTAPGFDVRGVEYAAKVGATGLELTTPNFSLKMKPVAVEQGATAQALGDGAPRRASENVAQIVRPEVVEEYVFENERIEQLFRFDRPPGEGELRVKIAMEGGLKIEKVPADQSVWRDTALLDGGLLFKNPDGRGVLAYHGAVAIDAAGRRQTLYPDVADGAIVLAVPDVFMATAAFPLVIDPWLEMNLSAQGGGVSRSARVSEGMSIALNGSGNPFVAWSDDSSGNFDVYVRFFNGFEWKDLGGSTLAGGISKNVGKSSHPSISLSSAGNPAVAWDDDTSGDFEIYVRMWNGSAWAELAGSGTGGGISRRSGFSVNPSIAVISTIAFTGDIEFEETPLVAWQQDVLGVSDIYVAFFFPGDASSDAGWYPLLGAPAGPGSSFNISKTPQGVSEHPKVTLDGFGMPWVAWQDTQTGNYEIYVRGYFPTGTLPVDLSADGRAFFNVIGGEYEATSVDLVISGYTSGFVTELGSWAQVQGSAWTLGDPLPAGPGFAAIASGISDTATTPSFFPSISIDSSAGNVYVAWQEGPTVAPPPAPPALSTDVFVRRLALPAPPATPPLPGAFTTAWLPMGGAATLNVSNSGRGLKPSIAIDPSSGGQPIVVWQDDTGAAGVGTIDQPEILARQFRGAAWADVGDAGSGFVQRGISQTTDLSFSPQVLPAGLGQYICGWTDGNAGAFDVYLKKFFIVDLVQLSLEQQNLAGVPLLVGESTPDTTVRLRANVRGESLATPPVFGVRAQFEVRPVGTPFIGTPTFETSLGTPTNAVGAGNVVEGLFNGAPNLRYAWRARAADQIGRVGPWQSFGNNSDVVSDFEVRLTIPTAPPTGLDQLRADGSTQISLGGTTPDNVVNITAQITPPDSQTPVQLQVEVQPVGTAFDDTISAQSGFVSSSSTVTLPIAASDGNFHWRVRTVPQSGTPSGWVSFGGNPETDPDFVVQAPVPAGASLGQFFLNGTTPIPPGGTSGQTGVVLSGIPVSPVPGGNVRLEFEVRPTSQGFTGVPTSQGNLVVSGLTSSATITLPFENYHWRARATTDANTSSGWVSFGGGDGTTDFRLFVAPPPVELDDKDKCGLTGLEAFLLVGLLAFRRRRR